MSAMNRNVGWMAMERGSGRTLSSYAGRGRSDAGVGWISSVLQHDGLEHREAVKRFEALLAAVSRMPDTAEGQLDAAARAVAVDEHLAAPDRAGDPELPAAVAGPHAR